MILRIIYYANCLIKWASDKVIKQIIWITLGNYLKIMILKVLRTSNE